MSDDLKKTIKIRRNEKAGTDSRGRTVWTRPIEPIELELLSTLMLEQIILSDDEDHKKQLHALTDGDDGVIACNMTNNKFEVLKDDELEAALQAANNPDVSNELSHYTLEQADITDVDEELSLVTTQVLRKILSPSSLNSPDELDSGDNGDGYDPYDKG